MHRDVYLGEFDYESFITCESCIMGKLPKSLLSRTREQVNGILELIHIDVCGLTFFQAKGGSFYFITFTDDFSRLAWVYLIRCNSKTFEKFKEFKN